MTTLDNLIYNEQIKQVMSKYGVSWFKFDEESGNVTDSKGTAVGTVNGVTRVEGWNGEGNALSFNGNGSVIFGSPIIPVGEKTIRFKVKTTSNANQGLFGISSYNSSSSGIYSWTSGGGIIVAVIKNGVHLIPEKSYAHIADGEWNDIMISWSGMANTRLTIYLNGVVVGSVNIPQNEGTNFRNLYIGYYLHNSTGSMPFNGELDDFQIYNKVLTPEDFIFNKTLILSSGEYRRYTEKTPLVISNTNAIPIMTSNTAPSGKADASSTYETDTQRYQAWNAFDGAIGNNGWVSKTAVFPQWVSYEYDNEIAIGKYSIVARTTTGSQPKSWTFEGSNDGVNFDILDTQTNKTAWVNGVSTVYSISNPKKYKIYRLNISENNGHSTYVGIEEIEMFEALTLPTPQRWEIVSTTLPTSTQFLDKGMDDLTVLLDRTVVELEPVQMIDDTVNNPSITQGKVFTKSLNLQKYLDIRSIRVEGSE